MGVCKQWVCVNNGGVNNGYNEHVLVYILGMGGVYVMVNSM